MLLPELGNITMTDSGINPTNCSPNMAHPVELVNAEVIDHKSLFCSGVAPSIIVNNLAVSWTHVCSKC